MIYDEDFRNSDDFEASWGEFVKRYSDDEVRCVSELERCNMIKRDMLKRGEE
jgi:hypothetical protein